MSNQTHLRPTTTKLGRGATAAVCVALAVLAFYLIAEHRAHTLGALPYLLLLSCPIVHLLGHRRHGHHHADHADEGGRS
jgi:hypothetical protein